MGKQTGSRPRPTVATDHSPSYNQANTGRAPGRSANKTPTGSRPRPRVAKSTIPGVKGKAAGRPAAKVTKMPTPKQNWGKRGGGKAHGGN